MQVRFEKDERLETDDIQVLVNAQEQNSQVNHLIDYIERYQQNLNTGLAVKADDHLVMLKFSEIILAELDGNQLVIHSTKGNFAINDSLINIKKRLPADIFLQISRFALININHLESLSDSFSGNMTAKLSQQLKTSVSRKYVKELMTFLGI